MSTRDASVAAATPDAAEPPGSGAARAAAPVGQLRALWDARYLLQQWVRRDFSVRYRQSALGLAWSLLQPLLLLTVYGLVFVRVLKIHPSRGSYLVFAFCGLVPWTFFATSVSSAVTSVSNAAPVIKQVAFPRVVIPLSAAGVIGVDLAIGTGLLLILQLATAHRVHPATLGIVPLLVGLFLLVSALSVFAGVVGAFVRDVRFVLPLLIQVGFIATPVMYPPTATGRGFRLLYDLNPVARVIAGIRTAVIDGHWPSLGLCAGLIGFGAALLVVAIAYSASVQDRLPDLV